MRKGIIKRAVALVMSVMCITSLVACGSGSTSENATYKDTFNVAIAQEAATMDIAKSGSLCAKQILNGTVYEKLLTLDANGEPIPELCESYTVSDDAKEFTFKLRTGVKFHDGSTMTAEDVIASMNRWIEAYSTAKALTGEARFEKIDDTTVKITLPTSSITFPYAIAGSTQMAVITTAAACKDEDSTGYMKQTIGTGPYKFDSWELGQYVRITKFADYVPYGDSSKEIDGMAGYKNAYLTTINYYYVPDEATRIAGLQTGQYDFTTNLTSDDYDMINNSSDFTAFKDEAGTMTAIFNKKQGIGTDLSFRQAVIAALDMDQVLTAAYGTFYSLGSCYMDAAQGAWVNDGGSSLYNQKNTTKAKELLAKSGYNGETITLLVGQLQQFPQAAEIIRQQLQNIGINVKVNVVDWATYTSLSQDPNEFDIELVSYSSVPVPSQKVYLSATYRGWATDEKLVSMMSEFNSATTIEAAKTDWKNIQEYCYEYAPIIHCGHYQSAYALSKKVSGVTYYNANPYFWNTQVTE